MRILKILYKIIEDVLDVLRINQHFQDYINTRYIESDNVLLVNKKYLKNNIYKLNNFKFYITKCMESLDTIENEYIYDDIRKDDVVVDIGANIGGFTCFVSGKCKHVFSVEPLFTAELRNNIELNNINNCTIIPNGLGCGIKEIEYYGNKKRVFCIPLSEIKKRVGGKIDFLKIDCEGCEWLILKHELDGIRRVEMELHLFNNEKYIDYFNFLKDAGFSIETKCLNKKQYLIHGTKINKNASDA